MSLARIAERQHKALRWQASALLLWAGLLGFATSTLLLQRYAVHSMALRYAAGAAAMVLGGLVCGGYVCLCWWRTRPSTDASFAVPASPEEVVRYRERMVARHTYWWNVFRWRNNNHDDDDTDTSQGFFNRLLGWVIGALLWLVMACTLTVLGLVFCYLPMLVVELLASYLAAVVLAIVVRAPLELQADGTPSTAGYWGLAARATWLAGLCLVALGCAVGHWLQRLDPASDTLPQMLLKLPMPW